MKKIEFLHRNCRNAVYPQSNVNRFPVPDQFIKWCETFAGYEPVYYESASINGKPYADLSIDNPTFKPKWNCVDGNVDRLSFHGDYQIENKLPLNPFGRTGIIGRGNLYRYGPNHAADPILTKWKRDTDGSILIDSKTGKQILQMVTIQRRDNLMWAIPGGFVDPGEHVTKTLKREFFEEAVNNADCEKLEAFFENSGNVIFSGYVDDPRNTDNAWIETVASNFHDDTGHILADIKLEAGDDAGNVKWIDIDKNIKLYASHREIIEKVVNNLNGSW